jgi:peptidyl serine alpha-galactosyltransferase
MIRFILYFLLDAMLSKTVSFLFSVSLVCPCSLLCSTESKHCSNFIYVYIPSTFYCTLLLTKLYAGQSYVFFHQLWKVGQTGHVTRIVSGCKDDEEERTLRLLFQQQIRNGIPTGKNRFHIHVTPDYSKTVPNVNYNPLNKPFGVLHWMENSLKMPQTLSQYSETLFIILDPDQILLRPFTTRDFGKDVSPLRWHNKFSSHVAQDGHPVSQMYAMGGHWISGINADVQRVIDAAWNATKDNPAFTSTMKSSSHLYDWTTTEVDESYSAGPPYLLMGGDMYRIAVVWAAVSAPVYELTVNHISEMFAYSTAAAHLNLPHDLAINFMYSNPEADWYEAWDPVEQMAPSDLCRHTLSDKNDPSNVQYRNQLPYILHFCQEYYHGPYYFFKYFIPNNFLSCEHPLLLDPTDHHSDNGEFLLVLSYNTTQYKTYDGRIPIVTYPIRQRHVYTLCHLIARVNEAVTFWKENHCPKGTANYNKIYSMSH